MSVYNDFAPDRSLIPFLYGQRVHPSWQVDRECVGRDSAPVIVPTQEYSPEFARMCERWPAAQRPSNGIMVYYGTRPIPQVPTQQYAAQWRCRTYKWMQEQGDVLPLHRRRT